MLPKRKKIIVLTAVLVAALGALVFFTSQRITISEEEAIAKVMDHLGDWEYIEGVKTELRPPTEQEKTLIRNHGSEPSNLIWVVEVTLGDHWPSMARVFLNAYTGEILFSEILV